MKREDLEKLGLNKEQIDVIMAENGKDVEAQKAKTTTAEAELAGLKTQLGEANKQIEGFKTLPKVEDVQKAADDWKTKAEQAQRDAAAQVGALKFEHALESALVGAKAKNARAVKALLNTEQLKFNEADGSIVGLKEQLEAIQKDNGYLFEDVEGEGETPPPTIVTGGKAPAGPQMSKLEAAMWKGSGLKPPSE